ncbi:multifunctional acyl-CoA thioesterase I/protease I/lysophospholipase L1 [Limnobaculum xujianqingii]|uniref:multifunctional acyl-CoA thioesterase I/protease I/lysophospholipase L1 n=1 Tax=Limnobaculum xujianqingii TaxID=2738837 RepID=UPI0015BDF74A|nr:multifunctional acyl-CoA thioesterase I/protease I/lysophospholipase L1 [Limnobaculum xujianqingii]
MNFKNIILRHIPILLLLGLSSIRIAAADTLLILGDSLSAGYQLPIQQAWATQLDERWKLNPKAPAVINASISGDTAAQGLSRLPELLKTHQPRWVLIELGANDGLRGFPTADIERDLTHIITLVKQANAQPLLMQIRISPNYGRRYTDAFTAIYPKLAQQHQIPLLPFFMEKIAIKPELMQPDGLHPTAEAQPEITDLMEQTLAPYVGLAAEKQAK